jgi:glycosyltransferase involved in cell wall biosynthesis
MVVTEALARGLPVIATSVGGIPEAVGQLSDGRRPALLVPSEDAGALADALRRWLENADLRATLRERARARRDGLRGWDATSEQVAQVLAGVAR